jgi:hypothetical protein
MTPFRRAGSDYVSASGRELVMDKIRQFCMTEPGELPWRPTFGAGLGSLAHMSNDSATAALARARITQGLRRWLGPGINVASVTPIRDVAAGSLTLNVVVTIDNEQASLLIEMSPPGGVG